MRPLRVTLIVIGVFQIFFGTLFLLVPGTAEHVLKLSPTAPAWGTWLLAMMAGRFIGYGIGMFAAARAPRIHGVWIDTMIFIQAVDWLATVRAMAWGHLGFQQVSTASFMPLLFIAALVWFHPRRSPSVELKVATSS